MCPVISRAFDRSAAATSRDLQRRQHLVRPVALLQVEQERARRRRPCPSRTRRSGSSARNLWAAGYARPAAYTSGSCSAHPQDLGRGEAGQGIIAGDLDQAFLAQPARGSRRILRRCAGRSTGWPGAAPGPARPAAPARASGRSGRRARTWSGRAPVCVSTAWMLRVAPCHHSWGSCSLHNGWGVSNVYSLACDPHDFAAGIDQDGLGGGGRDIDSEV